MITENEIRNLAIENNTYMLGYAVPAYEQGFFDGFTCSKAKEYWEGKMLAEILKHQGPIQSAPTEKPKQFECKIKTVRDFHPKEEEYFINNMGKDGWELVAVCKQRKEIAFYFKRERLEPEKTEHFKKK